MKNKINIPEFDVSEFNKDFKESIYQIPFYYYE